MRTFRRRRDEVEMDEHRAIDDLRRSALFAHAETSRLRTLASRAYVRRFAAGQMVFTEGEPSEHLYVVRTGRVRIFVASAQGEELTLTVLVAGDSIGELSVVDEQPRSASAATVEATELLAIGANDMRAALTADPALLWTFAGELATTVRRLTGSAADMVFLDLPRRLAKLMLAEATAGHDGCLHVELGMSQSGVAARLGVTRQSLNRALTGLMRRGWISVHGHGYAIDDLPALRRFADS
jgi:CRP-like cAMP-binding protein